MSGLNMTLGSAKINLLWWGGYNDNALIFLQAIKITFSKCI
jgi:hypothetical protein